MVGGMRRLAVALALVGGVVGVTACSYVFDVPAPDALPVPNAAEGDGAATDADIPETTPYVPEASIPFCETRPTPFLFCEDFDNEPPPDLATLGTVRAERGRVLLSNVVGYSPPRSLLTSTSGGDASAAIARTFEATPNGATLSFQLLVSALGPAPAQLSQLILTDGAAVCSVQLFGGPATFSITQVCTNGGAEVARIATDTAHPIARGQWHRYAVGLVFAPMPLVTFDVDGARIIEISGVAQLHAAPMSIELGIGQASSGAFVLFQDDVLVTTP